MQGWVSFHRKIEEWEWYDDANTFRLFFHLVLKANHKDNKWRGIDIQRGSLLTSNEQLAKQLKLSVSKIRTSLNKLKSTGEITIKTTNKNTVVTVVNYDLYQSVDEEIANKTTNKSQTNRKQIATNNNDNNENKKTLYSDVFDFYLESNLIKHKTLTNDMIKAIDKAKKEYDLDLDYFKRIITRHKQKVESTKDNEHKVKARPLAELFGQKKYNSVSLICSDYLDELYTSSREKVTPLFERVERW